MFTQKFNFFSLFFFNKNTLPAGYLSRPLGRQEIRNICLAGALMFLSLVWLPGLQAITFTWTGNVDDQWSEAGNWDCGGACANYPGEVVNTDDVILPGSSGTINLDVTVTVNDYTHNTGSILNQVGANVLTVSGTFTWTSGTVRAMVNCSGTMNFGTGVQLLQQAMTVDGTTNTQANSTFKISSSGSNLGKFINNGNYNWSGGTFSISNGTDGFENNSTFTITSFSGSMGGGSTTQFVNNGTVNKTAGAGTLNINTKFVNNGTISQTSGTKLDFGGGLDNNNGASISMNIGSTLEISGTGTLATGSTITGAETLRMSNGVTVDAAPSTSIDLDFFGSTVTWNVANHTAADVDLGGSGMTLQGTGSLIVTNSLLFQQIILKIPVTVNAGATCTINNSIGGSRQIRSGGTLTLKGATNMTAGTLANNGSIVNEGTFNWTGGSFGSAGVFDNSGTFTASSNGSIGSGGSFSNSGNFTWSSGTGTLSVGSAFNNTGTINHNTNGKMDFGAGVTNTATGTINVTASGTLETSGGALESGSSLTGSGTLRMASNFTVDEAPPTAFDLDFFGNTVNWNIADHTAANITLAGSGLTVQTSGSGSLIATNTLLYQRVIQKIPVTVETGATCTISNPLGGGRFVQETLTLKGITNMTSGTFRFTTGGSVENSGTFNWSGGTIQLGGRTINNTNIFNVSADVSLIGGGTFTNSNEFNRNGGTGLLLMDCDFDNNGVFEQSTTGTVQFSSGFSFGNTFTNDGTMQGIGTIDFGIFDQNNIIAPGLSPGTLNLDQLDNSSGIFNVEVLNNTGPGDGHDQLAVTAAVTLGGTLNVTLTGSTPTAGTTYTILTATGGLGGTQFGTVNFPSSAAEWSIAYNTNDVVITFEGVLPVELIGINAFKKENHIQLGWQTASETNNRGFEIQHSTDGTSWKEIGFMAGQGNSNIRNSYQFSDKNPQPGTNYYRLRQMDFDGTFSFSKTISVEWEGREGNGFSVYPNPISGNILYLKMPAQNENGWELTLINVIGQTVRQASIENVEAPVYEWEIPHLPTGVYWLQLQNGQRRWAQKLVVK